MVIIMSANLGVVVGSQIFRTDVKPACLRGCQLGSRYSLPGALGI